VQNARTLHNIKHSKQFIIYSLIMTLFSPLFVFVLVADNITVVGAPPREGAFLLQA
jgi:hypothetical protein